MFTAEMYSNNAGFKRHALNSWRIVRSVKDHICNPLKENFKAYASLLSPKLLALPLLAGAGQLFVEE